MARFFNGYQWRFVFADIPSSSAGGVVTSWANGILTNRQIAITLNQPTTITADVKSDDRQVNELFADGYRRVAQNKRVVYCLRREGGSPPWVCRAAGILMSPEDQANADVPVTHLTAYDPWKFLAGRPVVNAAGSLPPSAGYLASVAGFGLTGDQIVLHALKNTIVNQGFAFIDAGAAWGGTSFYGGHLETTPPIDYTLQAGEMVDQVWTDMCDAGNLDIVLTPIYDPINRPGYTHELNIYNLAGADQYSAVFGWDRMNRAVTTFDRMHDGTPGSFVNVIQYYAGQDGGPVPIATNPASIADFLQYWSQQFYPAQPVASGAAVEAMAQQMLVLRKQGLRTTTLQPTPERSPIPFQTYNIGDRVQVYASDALRAPSDGLQRVQGIPITIADDGIETVSALLLSPDYRTAPSPSPPIAGAGLSPGLTSQVAVQTARGRSGQVSRNSF